jgi:hypothetical protein
MTDALISLNWKQVSGEIGALMQRFKALPRHIAKKHLVAVMKRALRPGVTLLRAATPVGRAMRANKKGVVKMRRTGDLRRAATARSKYIGKNADGIVVGVLGYRYGAESQKAIWLEFGTSNGIKPRHIVRGVMDSFRPQSAAALAGEMAAALEKAAKELSSDKATAAYGAALARGGK